MLMHPKDLVEESLKQNVIYSWQCHKDGCEVSYIGETSRTLGECVKEHTSKDTSAIKLHSEATGHPSPNAEQFKIIAQDPSQVSREAQEATFILKHNPELN